MIITPLPDLGTQNRHPAHGMKAAPVHHQNLVLPLPHIGTQLKIQPRESFHDRQFTQQYLRWRLGIILPDGPVLGSDFLGIVANGTPLASPW